MSARGISPLPKQIYKMFSIETPRELFIFPLEGEGGLRTQR